MRLQTWFVLNGSALLLLVACADADNPSRGTGTPMLMMPNKPAQMPAMTAGASGGFGNPTQMAGRAGSAGMAPAMAMPMSRANCKGGLYLGMYNCNVDFGGIASPLEGDVSFALEIDETVVPGECDSEFCPDLVIAEGSGTLFGFAGLIAFEAKLQGGLDCQTGEFRATAPSGIYGIGESTDPNDPNALWTVADPPFGNFTGTLDGMHAGGPPERITGDWNLADSMTGTACPGPFMVTLQP